MKKILIIFLSLCTIFTATLHTKALQYKSTCAIDNLDVNEIVDINVIDGKVYIDILEKNNYPQLKKIGKCPEKAKYAYKNATKDELVKMRNDLDSGNFLWGTIIGYLVGLANPLAGLLAGATIGQKSMMSKAIDDALINRNKNNYTIKSTFTCIEQYQDSRGWVHRYQLTSIYIY